MILKVFGWVLGTIIILVFGVVGYFSAIQDGVATANATYPSGGNYTGLNEAIRFTPLAIVIGIIATPLACILIYKMVKAAQA